MEYFKGIFKLLIILWLLFCVGTVTAQKLLKVDLYGKVTDSITREALPYATIQLINIENGKNQYGVISDSTGKFFIHNAICHPYQVIVSMVGYTIHKRQFDLSAKGGSTYLMIKLIPGSTLLDDVTITAQSTGTNTYIDKTVFIPDSLSLRNSATALDLLSKAPGVSVSKATDMVKVLGNPKVMILIDGSNNDRDLKMIDPEDVERIEVITNPSSKYDSDVANVLNIVLKEESKKGIKISANINLFTENKYNNAGLQAEYIFSKFRVFGSFNFRMSNISTADFYTERFTRIDDVSYRDVDSSGHKYLNKFRGQSIKYGIDYHLTKKTMVNFTGSYGTYRNKTEQDLISYYYANDLKIYKASTYRNSDGTNSTQNYTLFARHKFNGEDHLLSWNTNLYGMNRDASLLQDALFDYTSDTLFRAKSTISTNTILALNSKLDYTRKIVEKLKVETGAQFYKRYIENNNIINLEADYFDYHDTRWAIYGSLIFTQDKFSVQTGIRAEQFSINIYDSVKFGQWNYLPAITTMYDLGEKGKLKLLYKQYLQYPVYQTLSPFFYYSNDSLNASSGNPFLRPEKLNNYEFNYSLKRKALFISVSAYYKRKNKIIGVKSSLSQDNVLTERYDNITYQNQYGSLIYFQSLFLKFMQLGLYVEGLYNSFEVKEYNGFELRSAISLEIPLPWDMYLDAEMTIDEFTREYNGYEYQSPLLDEITLGKSFLKDRAEINVSLINFFTQDKWTDKRWDQNYTEFSGGRSDSRCLLFRFNYFFKSGRQARDTKRELNMENDMK